MAERFYYTPAKFEYKEANLPDNISRMVQIMEPIRKQQMYNEARMDQFVEKFGEFSSPFQQDVDRYYQMLDNSGLKQFSEDLVNNPGLYRSPEFSQRLAQMKSKIDYGFISRAKQSKTNAENENKIYQTYAIHDLYNPNVHKIDYAGHSSSDNIYEGVPSAPYISFEDYAKKYLSGIKPKWTGELNDAGGGYLSSIMSNEKDVRKAATDTLDSANPQLVAAWKKDYIARTGDQSEEGFRKFMEKQVGQAIDTYSHNNVQLLRNYMDEAAAKKSSSGSGGIDISGAKTWAEMQMMGATTNERRAIAVAMQKPISADVSASINEDVKLDVLEPGLSHDAAVDRIDQLIADSKRMLEHEAYEVNKKTYEKRIAALEAAKNKISSSMVSNLSLKDTSVQISDKQWGRIAKTAKEGTGEFAITEAAPVVIKSKNTDESGSSENTFYKGKFDASGVSLTNANWESIARSGDDVMNAIAPGYDFVEGKPGNIPHYEYARGTGMSNVPAAIEVKNEDSEGYREKKKIATEYDTYRESEEPISNKYLDYLAKNIFSSEVLTTKSDKISKMPDLDKTALYLHGSKTIIPYSDLIEKTRKFGEMIASKYPEIGKKIIDNPNNLIQVFFQDKDGNAYGDNKSKATTNTVGKQLNKATYEKDAKSGKQNWTGKSGRPWIFGGSGGEADDAVTINFRYRIPYAESADLNYLLQGGNMPFEGKTKDAQLDRSRAEATGKSYSQREQEETERSYREVLSVLEAQHNVQIPENLKSAYVMNPNPQSLAFYLINKILNKIELTDEDKAKIAEIN